MRKGRLWSFIVCRLLLACNDSIHKFVIAKAEGLWQSINHYFFIHSQKNKRNHHPLPPSSLRDFVEVVAIHKPQNHHKKTKKKKKSPPFAPFIIIRSKITKQSTNHYFFIHSQKRKRIYYYLLN